ncbi:MAG: TPM domain-containing protein [Lachnospiraceae bacterium]|nr:TPM domain-containing protein [Lachnospiraceae bacterium]
MKKHLYFVILTFFAFSLFTSAGMAKASNVDYSEGYFEEKPETFIVDGAGLLTEDELALVNEAIISFNGNTYSKERNFIICIVTTNDLHGKSAVAYADDFYDKNYYKYGYTNGLCLLRYINGNDRYLYISTCGEAITIFNDAEIEFQIDLIADYIIAGDYKKAFLNFIYNAENQIRNYDRITIENNSWNYDDYNVYDDYYEHHKPVKPVFEYEKAIVISLIVGVVTALIIVSVMKSKLYSVKYAVDADSYLVPGSFKVTRSQDMFLSRHVSKTEIPRDSGSSGHSSTHRSSSGISHGGGGRRI